MLTATARAETRIALVIGNSDYEKYGLLPNPRLDAEAVGDTLRTVGFDVLILKDQKLADMNRALNAFAKRAQTADVSLIYYAGHGVGVDGTNYVIPTDANITADADVGYQAVSLDLVTNAVRRSHGLGIVILDACRDNPFIAAMVHSGGSRSINQGFGKVDPPSGTMVAFSAAEGAVALDGKDGGHSPFAEALIRYLPVQGLEINLLLGKVHEDVMKATGDAQSPRMVSAVNGTAFYFAGPPAAPKGPMLAAAPSGATALTVDGSYVESQYWDSIKTSNDPDDYRAYLDKYPNGQFAALGRNRLRNLSPAQVAPSPAPAPAAPAPAPAPVPAPKPQPALAANAAARPTAASAPAAEPPPMRLASLPPPDAPIAQPANPLVRPAMIAFEVPKLPAAFCSQVDMNSYLTDFHAPLDRASKANNQAAIRHLEAVNQLYRQYMNDRPGTPDFDAARAEALGYQSEAALRFQMANLITDLDAKIRLIPVNSGAACAHGPWPDPLTHTEGSPKPQATAAG